MKKDNFFTLLLGLFAYLLFIIFYSLCELNQFKHYDIIKYILSIVGMIIYIYIIKLNYNKTKKILTLFTIIFSFLFLFNFGQCILWIFNIHPQNSIGETILFNAGYPTDSDIVKTQLVTLTSIFLYGITITFNKKNIIQSNNNESQIDIEAIKITSIILGIISTICTYIILFNNIKISLNYGYNALYYGENMYQGNIFVILLSRFFLPSLYGLFLTNYKNKKIVNLVYLIFFVYLVGNLITGDRGSWVYSLCFFIWLHHTFIKKINFKKTILLAITGILTITIIYAIVEVRDSGISISKVIEAISFNNNPIIKLISELGSSMKIQLYLLMTEYNIYPYGNTYLLGILGIFSDQIVKIFIPEYIIIDSWFSQTYLQLNYGAGFSIVGEAILNTGPYLAPLPVMLIGYIINSATNNNKVLTEKKIESVLFCLCCSISLISLFRGVLAYSIKMFAYQVIFFFLVIKIIKLFLTYKLKK